MQYIQFGCGLCAPKEWINFDASPTLRLQKTFGRSVGSVSFPKNVRYGNIVKGLPIQPNSCNGIYSSHTLEHLSLNDCKQALRNCFSLLKPGGILRCVVPDLETMIDEYNETKDAVQFVSDTLMGFVDRPRGVRGMLKTLLGNDHHLWMWDYASLSSVINAIGFVQVRRCAFGDSEDKMFTYVEQEDRFRSAVAIEAKKP